MKRRSLFSRMRYSFVSKIADKCQEYAHLILNGRLMAIDPSSGSAKSVPGYAIYEAGILVDSGTLNVPPHLPLPIKLRMIADSLRNEFKKPDVIAIEFIAPFFKNTGKQDFINKNTLALHRSVGAIYSAVNCDCWIDVSPISWRTQIPENYNKTDENDAIMIGYTCIRNAAVSTKQPVPPLKDLEGKLTGGISA